ncbi:MAG: ComF family protein [Bacteroidota bacterium]
MTLFRSFLSLIFPSVCFACGKALYDTEDSICTLCHYHLPKTNYHLYSDNPVTRLFWGRVNISAASSCYRFAKDGKVQQLIHHLKYRGQKNIGKTVGRFYGAELLQSELFSTVELIVPVPLHKHKLKKRGYNQSDLFAEGLAQAMKKEYDPGILVRGAPTETQTRKSRFARFRNVDSVFHLRDPGRLEGKHILLVDDVVTTGSTLEACAGKLLEVPGVKVSVATIAHAEQQ